MKLVFLSPHLLFFYLWLSFATLLGQPPLTGPAPGVLALRNGQVIAGNILRDGDRYLVTLAGSAELRIRADTVEFYGRDLQQLYQFKHAALVPDDITGRLRLVEWSLRQGLLTQAESLLEQTAPHQRRIPQWTNLRRRLTLAHRPAVSASPPPPRTSLPSAQSEVDRMLQEISSGSLQEFTAFVQPLLLNRCSTTTCHGGLSKTTFTLIRPSRRRAIPARYTQRNLYNTWKTLDSRQPDRSPLINITTAPHGGAPALFTQREWTQYQRLVNWVRRAASKSHRPIPDEIQAPATILAQPTGLPNPTEPPKTSSKVTGQATASLQTLIGQPRRPLGVNPSNTPPDPPKSLPHVVDPFDPALFNRQFHPGRASRPDDSPTSALKSTSPTAEPVLPIKGR